VPYEKKDKDIVVYMPRKNGFLVDRIMKELEPDTRRSVKLIPIEGFSEQRVAETLGRASIFLAISTWDGFPLPPMEAMMCGALVVGFLAGGGSDYLRPGVNCIGVDGPVSPRPTIDDATVCKFAECLAGALRTPETRKRLAAQSLAEEHTLEREAHAWTEALDSLF
jgi:glycosyltransferase involved in cell wall biosynthesis